MEVIFVPVRVGKFRNDKLVEQQIKNNYETIKKQIRDFVNDIPGDLEIHIDIIIPSRGCKIKLSFDSIQDSTLRKQLVVEFSKSLFKGDTFKLLEHTNNRIFPLGI